MPRYAAAQCHRRSATGGGNRAGGSGILVALEVVGSHATLVRGFYRIFIEQLVQWVTKVMTPASLYVLWKQGS